VLWLDAIQGSKYDNGDLKLRIGRIVKLHNFNFTEWFPWLPGMFWTKFGIANKDRNLNNANERNGVLTYQNSTKQGTGILNPDEKTLSVLVESELFERT